MKRPETVQINRATSDQHLSDAAETVLRDAPAGAATLAGPIAYPDYRSLDLDRHCEVHHLSSTDLILLAS